MSALTTTPAAPRWTGRGGEPRWAGRGGEPRWAGFALPGVLLLAAVLYGWGLSRGGYANEYYSAAVRSGASSWKAFFFGSLDSASFITVDKPPMALWVQELFARLFGFGWQSLLLPSVLMGVAAVALLYATVRRVFGPVAGLLAALVMTLTPITVAIDHDNNPDTLLVLLLVLAAWACQRAVESGRLAWLSASAFFLGCGFNTKMLQAYLLLPALLVVYACCAPGGLVRRIRHLAVAGAVLAVSSFWWMVVVDLIPAAKRPYIGGSTDGTVWDLVIGYNGLGRVFGGGSGGPGGPGGPGRSGGGPGGGPGFAGTPGWGRLFNDVVGGQISWLLPFAMIALVAGTVLLWRRPRTDLRRAALVLWGGWLVVHFAVFSLADGIMHPYYTTAMAPAIGALTGIGTVLPAESRRDSKAWGWVLTAAVTTTGVWSFVLLRRTPSWHPWLAWTVAALTTTAAVLLTTSSVRNTRRTRHSVPGEGAGRPAEIETAGGPAHRESGTERTQTETPHPPAEHRPTIPGRAAAVAVIAVIALAACLIGPAAYAVSAAANGTNGSNPLTGPSTGGRMGGPGMPGGGPPAVVRGPVREGGLPSGTDGSDDPSGNAAAGNGTPSNSTPSNSTPPDNAPANDTPGNSAPGNSAPTDGAARNGGLASGGPGPFGAAGGSGPGMGQVDTKLIAYLEKHRDGATWLLAVGSAQSAAPIIIKTGRPVIAMGGFTGSDPAMTVSKLREYVREGRLHYVMTGNGGGPGGGSDVSVTAWVVANCSAVQPSAYGGGSGSAGTAATVYRCG